MASCADILNKAMAALEANEALTDWCLAAFGRAPLIANYDDDQDPASKDDYPLLVLDVIDDGQANNGNTRTLEIDLDAAVENGAVTLAGRKRIFEGRNQVERLRELAVAALFRAALGRVESVGGVLTFRFGDLWHSSSTLSVTNLKK